MSVGHDITRPSVCIGMPVYNGAKTISQALESILNQTHSDFELIISDNNSTDETQQICEAFAASDSRIKYFRQQRNLGPALNFDFVFKLSRSKYFMWAAADDIRSLDYLEVNLSALEHNPSAAAAGSINFYEQDISRCQKHIDFGLYGGIEARLLKFLDNIWNSHGIFYSVFRRCNLENMGEIETGYTAFDWSVDWRLVMKGEFVRSKTGFLMLGDGGYSKHPDSWSSYPKKNKIETFFPLFYFSRFALLETMSCRNFFLFIKVSIKLLKINYVTLRNVVRKN